MQPPPPAIYAPRFVTTRVTLPMRLVAAVVALGCAGVLGVAIVLPPNPEGIGTHTSMGFSRCEFLYRTGIPCPSCGMTTSFAHFVRGNLAASVYVQPMGFVLAVLTTAAFWVSSYIAVTAKPALRLLQMLPTGYYLLLTMFFALAAWGWKIFIHLRGMDGW
jgi:hypothetical protein